MMRGIVMKTFGFWILAIWFAAVVAGIITYYFAPTTTVEQSVGPPSPE
jgi:hypothetical protein